MKYIKAMLEYIGCSVITAYHGAEVLEKLKTSEVECILMDKNMPGLDGIEATKIIRNNEQETGRHLPIIALTASAIAGERERVLSEGMDYYLAKPLDELELISLLKKIRNGGTDENYGNYCSEIEKGFVDRKTFLEEAELFGQEIITEIISDFLEDYEERLEELKKGILAEEYERVRKEAHRMAGTLSNFHCSSLVDLLKKMETHAANKQMEDLKQIYGEVEKKLKMLKIELREILDHFNEKAG